MKSDIHIEPMTCVSAMLQLFGAIMGEPEAIKRYTGRILFEYVDVDASIWNTRTVLLLSVLNGIHYKYDWNIIFIHHPDNGIASIDVFSDTSEMLYSSFNSVEEIITHVLSHVRAQSFCIKNNTIF